MAMAMALDGCQCRPAPSQLGTWAAWAASSELDRGGFWGEKRMPRTPSRVDMLRPLTGSGLQQKQQQQQLAGGRASSGTKLERVSPLVGAAGMASIPRGTARGRIEGGRKQAALFAMGCVNCEGPCPMLVVTSDQTPEGSSQVGGHGAASRAGRDGSRRCWHGWLRKQ